MNLHNSPSEINACCPNGITRSHRRCEVVFGRLLSQTTTQEVEMFARNVSIHLKPNSSVAFTQHVENESIPTLRKQAGFQGELTFLAAGVTKTFAISLCD